MVLHSVSGLLSELFMEVFRTFQGFGGFAPSCCTLSMVFQMDFEGSKM